MAFIAWKPEYSVGSVMLDAQHKQLVEMINDLHESMQKRSDPARIRKILDDLIGYTRLHFAQEEKTMERAGYPDLAEHQKIHRSLVAQVEEMRAKHETGSATFTLKLKDFLKQWLLQHILQDDMRYSPYLKN